MRKRAYQLLSKILLGAVVSFSVVVSAHAAPLGLQDVPLYLLSRADPNVLINMSVETPMGGAAYTDNVGVPAGCAGRRNDVLGDTNADDIGSCYIPGTTYLGYFDSRKCYSYTGNQFNPSGLANASYQCSGSWSGNFLNWATMTAIDMFVWTMTGGNRVVDTTSETVIRRARKQNNDSWFPRKVLDSSINVAPSTVTPYANATLFIHQTDFGFRLGSTFAGARDGTGAGFIGYFDVRVRVCDPTHALEPNCVAYGSPAYYKPEGSIQRNAMTKRFAAISYTLDGSQERNGGVLRSNMKYVGPLLPDGSINPAAEYGTNGILIHNPDGAAGSLNSGIINYINKFSDPGYKSHDPIGELFYESIRFFKNLGPTPEYSSGLTTDQYGGFQIVSNWEDPVQYRCQKNFIIAINDANPWLDKTLPGTYFTSATLAGASGDVTLTANDFGQPSNADTSINVTALTNQVGALEGLNGISWANSGTWTSGSVSGALDGVGGGLGTFDNSCTTKTVANLGEVMGTCPYPPKQNSYYVAGLAYYANTTDLRTDHANDRGIQNVMSFVIDTQEYASNPLDGPRNMLWLAGKYGGFNDENGDRIPQPNEWDADNDGVPDNYVLATQPQNLVNGLDRAFDFIDRTLSSASSASVNSGSISDQTRIYQTRFNSSDWTGQLLAFRVNADGTLGDGTGPLLDNEALWDASNQLPAPEDRQIITRDSTGARIPFQWASLSTTRRDQLDPDATRAEAILEYLRGDESNEGTAAGQFRARRDGGGPNKLGDIISSAPLFVGAPPFRYRDSLESTTYSSFAAAMADRTPMVYVGSNDGMLHGFNAETGREVFAYIPSPVFPRLKNLALQNYTHQYYVDGSPSMGDVFWGTTWKTVLVGGLNKGGQGIYALNITNPSTLANAEANAGSIALWEYTDANDSDLGYTFSQPSIVKLRNGRWAAVFGNGYNSTYPDSAPSSTGNAVLFIVDIQNGTLIRKLDTGVGNAQRPTGVSWDNGLSTPALVDINGDRIVEYAYAGDLFGNMWKFDLSSTDPAQWEVAFGTAGALEPLFTARDSDESTANVQPITSRPEITRGPGGQGMMVLFGTGKYLESSDVLVTPERPQTFYGIFDRNTGLDADRVTSRASLTEQTILQEVTIDPPDPDGDGPLGDPGPVNARVTSNNSMNNSGWYIDLVSPSGYEAEKAVTNPIVRNGNVIFTTVIPDTNPCGSGGRSWLMEVSALSGARLDAPPFDLNQDGLFTDADAIAVTNADGSVTYINVSAIASEDGMGILQSPGVIDGGQGVPLQFKYSPGSSGGIQRVVENPGIGTTGRQSWRQLR